MGCADSECRGAASCRRVVSGKPPHIPASATFSLVAGSHTHYFAAEIQRDAELWVTLIRETWLHCFSHTARCMDGSGSALTAAAAGVAVSQKLMAENALLRDSIQSLNQQVTQANGEYWRWVLVRCQRCVLGCAPAAQHSHSVFNRTKHSSNCRSRSGRPGRVRVWA